MGDFKKPTALLEKSRGISLVLGESPWSCSILDPLITWIPADEEPLCGNATVYAIIIIIIIIINDTTEGVITWLSDLPCVRNVAKKQQIRQYDLEKAEEVLASKITQRDELKNQQVSKSVVLKVTHPIGINCLINEFQIRIPVRVTYFMFDTT